MNKKPSTFRDADGREWQIKLNSQVLHDIEQSAGVDIMPGDNDVRPLAGLLHNHRKLGAALWVLCEGQAKEKRVDQKSFNVALDGDALRGGWDAIVEAVIGWYTVQSPEIGKAIRDAIDAHQRSVEAGARQLVNALGSAEVNAAIEQSAKATGDEMKAGLIEALQNSRR